ncbi:hypothetical protein Naga_101553g2, partial [Nannochloropsis gaditana]
LPTSLPPSLASGGLPYPPTDESLGARGGAHLSLWDRSLRLDGGGDFGGKNGQKGGDGEPAGGGPADRVAGERQSCVYDRSGRACVRRYNEDPGEIRGKEGGREGGREGGKAESRASLWLRFRRHWRCPVKDLPLSLILFRL